MKIIGFGEKTAVKNILRDNNIEPSTVRKVVTMMENMEVYFHNGSPMKRVPITKSLTKSRK